MNTQTHLLSRKTMTKLTGKAFLILLMVMVMLSAAAPKSVFALGEVPAQIFFLSMPEDQVRTAFLAIDTGSGSLSSTMVSITSIAVTVNGTIIYYDHWEDGYEAASTTPVQASTLIFGDGNTANGNACTYAATLCTNDVLTAGAVVALRNDVPSNPRGTSVTFDARDKLATTQVVAVTRAMWDSTVGTVLAGALQVYDTNGYGTDFRLPVGENFPDTATVTTTIQLYPNSDVSNGSWAEGVAGADADTVRYNEIDEASADDDTTYILSSGQTEYQAGLASPTVPADATNISVSIVWRGRDNSNNNQNTNSRLRVNGTYYTASSNYNLQNNNYTTYTDTWNTNPAAGNAAWTPATVNTVNGLAFDTSGNTGERITQGFIEVSYDTTGSHMYDNQMFEYDSIFVMAANDGTVVSIDSDGNGTTDYTANLNAGQAYLLNGAATGVTINSNAHITSNLPIQVNMITGDIDSSNKYENRWFNIPPVNLWGNSYVTPVGSPNTDSPSNVFLYNPNGTAITVNYQVNGGGSGSFVVSAGETYRYQMPVNSGARFSSPDGSFLAVGTVDSANVTGDDGRTWDWGYTLIAEEQLAPSLAVGWAPGSNALPPTNNGSPVWVSAAAATTIYIDYDGNPATGPNVDVNGNHYNTSQTVSALQSIRVFDSDNDQTGMRVYTVDGTMIAAAWGEDPATAGTGNPYLDMGYVVFPLPQMSVTKDGVLDVTASAPADKANVGDIINYTLKVTNKGTRTLHNVTLVDSRLATLTCTPSQPATLAMNQSMTCTGAYTVTQADIDAGVVYNTATGDSNETPPITTQGVVKIPKLVVTKTANPTAVPETGGSVTFTFTVKNDNATGSDVDLTIKSLTDTVYGTLAGDGDCQVGTVLAPQATCSFTLTTTVAGDYGGPDHVNKFTTIAEDSAKTSVSASSQATVTFTDVNPAIDVEKYVSIDGGATWLDADTAPGPDAGSSVIPQFRFVITNTGPVALTNVDLVDSVYGNISLNGTLAVGASAEYTKTGTWSEGQHSNTATVTGDMTDGAGNTETATDTDNANYFGARPALSLVKRASPATYAAVGQEITYSYVVKNTGNVPADGPVTVTDDKATPSCPAGGLAPGAEMICTATYTITQDDLDSGTVKNTAQAHANGVNSNSDDETVTAVQTRALSLTKSADPGTYDVVGQIIQYTFVIKNTGNVTLSGPFSVADNKALDEACTQPADGKLSPDEEMTCTASYTVTQADLDASSVTNLATASNGTVTSNQATATVYAVAHPNLALVKTAAPGSTYDSVGDVIHYNYTVTNTGNVAVSAPYTLADDKALNENCPQTPNPLPVGGSITCTASYTVTQADLDAGQVLNKAVATAQFGGNDVTSNEAQETVTGQQNPALAIDKTATEADYDAVGDVIHYSYKVTNSGNVTLHDAITVTDNKTTASCPALPAGGLAPGAYITCTASYTIQQSDLDAGSLTNVASAASGTVVSPSDTVTVPAVQTPHMKLVKNASPATYVAAGEIINYTYDLTNDGNVTLTGPFTVTDDKASPTCPAVESLAVGDTLTCTASHSVVQAEVDSGSITNVARGHGYFGTTPVNTNQDTKTVTAVQSPALTIVKTADPTTYDAVGNVINYSFLVTNSGNVTLTDIQVLDDKAANESCPSTASGLAPGASITCHASYTIKQADLDSGSVTNTAYAKAGDTQSEPDSETVNAIQQGGLGLSKSADPATYNQVGNLITYTYVVENTGNITLAGPFTVNDDKVGAVSCPAGSLAPGGSVTCTATYAITQADLDAGHLTNIATATDGTLTSNPATATVAGIQSPALAIDKTAAEANYAAVGNVIHYSYEVTNTGNVTLHDAILVSDDKAGDESCPALRPEGLAPGSSILCTASYTITQPDLDAGSLTNVASASSGSTASGTDTVTVPAVQSPALTLKKSANPLTYAAVGQVITYDYLLTNTGNVTLSSPFAVSDDKATVTCPSTVTSLAPNDTLNCTANYTISQADLDGGSVTNVATASAEFNTAPVTSNQDTATVTAVQSPVLTLVKAASPSTYDHVGQVISYSYVLTNDGNVTISGPFQVADDMTGNETCPATPAVLVPGASITCTASYTISQADLDNGSVTNTAQGKGSFNDKDVLSNVDSETVNATAAPGLSLTKSALPATYDAVGQTISYTYVLKNIGNVTLAGPFTVSDNKAATTNCPDDATLPVGDELTCTATYAITQADLDAGWVTNIATGHAQTLGGTPVNSNDASATVRAEQSPALSIDKTAAEADYDAVGDVIHYSYVVTNSGNVTLHDAITVSDNKTTATCPALPAGGLVPGASITCSATYTIKLADLDAGSLTNVASAASGTVVSPTDSATVPAVQTPLLSLVKTATAHFSTPVKVGDSISYTLVATNTGNITLSDVTITDPKLGALSCTPGQPAALLPGAVLTCSGSYALTQDDLNAGKVDNTATVDSKESEPASDSESVPAPQSPALTLSKSGALDMTVVAPSNRADAGDKVTYTLTAKNEGNVTLTHVTISDPKLGVLTCAQPATLLPGETLTCTGSYTLTQADIDAGKVDNKASAGSDQTPPVDTPVQVPVPQTPHINITKVADLKTYSQAGQVIGYTMVATNNGNVTLTDVEITDPVLGTLSCTPAQPSMLVPGASMTCTGSYIITQFDVDSGQVINTAGVTGQPPAGGPVSDAATETITANKNPALSIVKTATPATYNQAGDVISYAYAVTNSGNLTLYKINVVDDKVTVTCPDTTAGLAPGESINCTASYTITQTDVDSGSVTNTAHATDGTIQSPPDSETVTAEQNPALSIVKTATPASYDAVGDVISYSYLVTNSGNITLHNIRVTDDKATVTCPAGASTMLPGESVTCTASYTITQADLNAGSVTNSAYAKADEAQSSPDNETVTADQNPGLSLIKTATPKTYDAAGNVIGYSYLVKNTGNVTLYNISVVDDKATVTCPASAAELAPQAEITCTASYTIVTADLYAGSVTNTAYATDGTVQSQPDSETVTTEKKDLTISKTAVGAFHRTDHWKIDKSAADSRIEVPAGTTAKFDYAVKVSPDGYTDSAWTVKGKITVTNPNYFDIQNAAVSDLLNNGGACTVTGGANFAIPAVSSVDLDYECTYAAAPSPAAGANTATVTWNKTLYGTPNGTASATAPVNFSIVTPTTSNATITVVDDQTTGTPVTLGTWDWADGEHTFTYSLEKQGVAGKCTNYTNTATISETGQKDSQTVTVCVGLDLTVSKTAAGSYDRAYLWEISKAADKTTINIAAGGLATFNYTVTASQTGFTDSGWTMNGTITVNNPNDWEAITTTITDAYGGGGTCAVTNGTNVVVPAGGSVTRNYTCTFSSAPAYSGTNTATATWNSATSFTPSGSATGTSEVTLVQDVLTNKTITVTDNLVGDLGTVTATDMEPWASKEFKYSQDFAGVGGTCTEYDNTATITETKQTATATVKVCVGLDLTVSKTAAGTFGREYLWQISKAADKTTANIAQGGSASFTYTIIASQTGVRDSGWTLAGKITVTNPNDWESVTLSGLTDAVNNGGTCTIAPVAQLLVPANGTLVVDYSCAYASAPTSISGTNTATATWDPATAYTPSGSASGASNFTLTQSGTGINKTIHVTDSQDGAQGTVTATDAAPWASKEFTYTKSFSGVGGTCTSYDNTATITETGQTAEATVTVCVGLNLTVSKTAAGSFDRAYQWSISKAADKTTVNIAAGGLATFNYTVTVQQTGFSNSGWTLAGDITVHNPNDWEDVTLTGLTDAVNNGGTCTVDPGPYVVPAGKDLVVHYTCAYTSASALSGTNTATATWDKAAAFTPAGTASGASNFTLTQSGSTNKTIHVTDSLGGDLGTVTATDASPFASKSFPYSHDFAGVGGTCTDYDNTATITETGQSASKTVTVCAGLDLTIAKTAYGTFDRTYLWQISKAADQTQINIAAGGTATFNYTVIASQTGFTDSGWMLTGKITLTNPNDWEDITLTSLTDVVDNGGTCTLAAGPYKVLKGSTLEVNYSCTYTAASALSGSNTATANWNKATSFTPSGSAAVTQPFDMTQTGANNKTVTITDSLGGDLGTVTATDMEPWASKEFKYSHNFAGVGGTCKSYDNTATITETKQTAKATVKVCAGLDLTVSKTAAPSFTRTWDWEIVKEADGSYDRFIGQSATHGYTVTVTPTSTDNLFKVLGAITITNPNDWEAVTVDVADLVDNGGTCVVDSSEVTVPAKGSTNVGYTCTWTVLPGSYSGANTATITWDKDSFFTPTGTASGSKGFEFTNPTEINPTIHVDDNSLTGENWTATRAETNWKYDKTYTCPTDASKYVNGKYTTTATNTATITETKVSDSATVALNCYIPAVSKTAAGSYDLRSTWDVAKSVTPASQSAFAGDSVTYTWKVTVTEGSEEDNFSVAGEISVTNPAPMEMTVDLADKLGGGTVGVIGACSNGIYDAGKLTIPANSTATCGYTAAPSGRTDTVNNVTVTLNGIVFKSSAAIAWTPVSVEGIAMLDDDQNPAFPIDTNASGTWTYDETYTCSTDLAAYDAATHKYAFSESNTATLTWPSGTDSATAAATVNCYVPALSKSATGTFTEIHDWEVFKSASPTLQTAFAGEKKDFTWTVRVDETIHGESYVVKGKITVVNPNPEDALTVALTDALDDGSVATIGPCSNGTWAKPNLTVAAGKTAVCDYTVTPTGDLDALAAALPDTVTMTVTNPYPGGPAYFPVTTISGGGPLNGTYEGWCVDPMHGIDAGTPYTAKVYSSYEDLPAGLVGKPENFDLVNWIINQDFVGKDAGGSLGAYTYSDVQYAIWKLIDLNSSSTGLYDLNTTRAEQIVSLALANGEGFRPTCGDYVAVVLEPNTSAVQIVTIAQVTFASLGVDCANTNVATAVLNGIQFPASANILWTATEVNPTANLDDTQKPDWPVTVDADTTFTYQDPQGYTCSTSATAYKNGMYEYTEWNNAKLTFGTSSDTASAYSTVKCYIPVVSKTVETYWERDWDWTITKDYDGNYKLFPGDSVAHGYKVAVAPTKKDNNWGVKGAITIANPNPNTAMTLTSVTDLAGGIPAVVSCPSLTVPAGGSLVCPYDTGKQNQPNDNPFGSTNTATAVLNGSNWTGSAAITFSTAPTTEMDAVIHVDDDNLTGESWTADRTAANWTYSKSFTCPTDRILYKDGKLTATTVNTATITETGQKDSASVTRTCYWPQIDLTKTGDSLSKIGDGVTYTLTLKNNTPADAGLRSLSCTILDSMIGFSKTVTLASGATSTSTKAFTIPMGAEDPFVNEAAVVCKPVAATAPVTGASNFLVDDEARWSTNLFQPKVKITKTAPSTVTSGVTVTYTFTIQNLSSSDSPDLLLDTVKDNVLGDLKPLATAAGCSRLAYGASCTFTKTAVMPTVSTQAVAKKNIVTVHMHPEGFSNDITANDNHTVVVAPGSQLTDTSYCPLPKNQFKLNFQAESATAYKLNATNPGQFYYNGFYYGKPGDPFTMTLQVPYPFMTQEGAGNPIQVHDGAGLTSSGCYNPTASLPGYTIQTAAMTPTSNAGNQIITPEDYAKLAMGQTTLVTVKGVIPESGMVYVTIHLDYGLKKTSGWALTGKSTKNPVTGASVADLAKNGLTIHGYEVYNFNRTVGADQAPVTPSSTNVIKKVAGFFGTITDIATGKPVQGVKVNIYKPNGSLLKSVTTDANGVYTYAYTHTLASATYTITLPAFNQSKQVTVLAKGFAAVDFEIDAPASMLKKR